MDFWNYLNWTGGQGKAVEMERSCEVQSFRFQINDAGSIVIYAATVEDAGPYVCTASNVIGSDSRRVDLDVWGKFYSLKEIFLKFLNGYCLLI